MLTSTPYHNSGWGCSLIVASCNGPAADSIIGSRVFCEVAAHCSFLAARSREIEEKLHLSTRNTGGTEAPAEVVNNSRKPEGWSA